MPATRDRDELLYLLSEAAELEHLLCCQYLFAAFSLKRSPDEGLTWEQMNAISDWHQTLLLVARQEMEHLGLVGNLLTALGGSPHFRRPNFPQPAKYYPCAMSLERFSVPTMKRFICFERPDFVSPAAAYCTDPQLKVAVAPRARALPRDVAPGPVPYSSVGELYEIIAASIREFPARDSDLFIGPPEAQVGGAELGLNFARIGGLGGGYDVTLFPITDRASALRAIDLIIEQGEGTSQAEEHTHYRRFCRILEQLEEWQAKDPGFDPARQVVSNPRLHGVRDAGQGTRITNPLARSVLDLFNAAYETMLLLLMRFYAHTDETPAELEALKYAAFFPMMTMAIRPLSEVLTELPARQKAGAERAGPSFEYYNDLTVLPHKQSAWIVLSERLDQLAAGARAVADKPQAPARMAFIAESLALLAEQFKAAMGVGR